MLLNTKMNVMKIIVAPTDFSTISLNAVNYATDMACILGANLALVHVCPIPVSLSDVPVPPYPFEELISDAERKMEELKNTSFFLYPLRRG